MAKRHRASVREALEAATSAREPVRAPGRPVGHRRVGEESQAANDGAEGSADGRQAGSAEADSGKQTSGAEQAPRTGKRRTKRGRPKKEEGHRKTSTGYLTSSGQKIVRLTLHLTPEQKRTLKIKSLEAGFENTSAFIVETLDL